MQRYKKYFRFVLTIGAMAFLGLPHQTSQAQGMTCTNIDAVRRAVCAWGHSCAGGNVDCCAVCSGCGGAAFCDPWDPFAVPPQTQTCHVNCSGGAATGTCGDTTCDPVEDVNSCCTDCAPPCQKGNATCLCDPIDPTQNKCAH